MSKSPLRTKVTEVQPTAEDLIRKAVDPRRTLAFILQVIAELDPSVESPGPMANYENRNSAIYLAVRTALLCGYPAGVCGSEDPEWPVAYITLPTGQVSWHIPAYPEPWDNHTTEEKYDRIQAYCDSIPPVPPL